MSLFPIHTPTIWCLRFKGQRSLMRFCWWAVISILGTLDHKLELMMTEEVSSLVSKPWDCSWEMAWGRREPSGSLLGVVKNGEIRRMAIRLTFKLTKMNWTSISWHSKTISAAQNYLDLATSEIQKESKWCNTWPITIWPSSMLV